MDQVEHVVCLVGRRRHQPIEVGIFAVRRIIRRHARRIVDVVRRQVSQQIADQRQTLAIVVGGKVRDAAGGVVRHCAAELLLADFFVGDHFDDVGRSEHITRVLHHDLSGDRRRNTAPPAQGPIMDLR
jgi:hypothetical protein